MTGAMEAVLVQLRHGLAAKKCWSCGCYHGLVTALQESIAVHDRPDELKDVLAQVGEVLQPVRYDCLGCHVCYPALASDAMVEVGGEKAALLLACPGESPRPRAGWPPLPGNYTPLRYHAPVAICTLTDDHLAGELARLADPDVAIVGTLQTENLGIERLIQNVVADPNIRFLIVCGRDSQQAVGHLPGQALVALAANGIDDSARIIGALGKRPVLRNVDRGAVEHFRQCVTVLDLRNAEDPAAILAAVHTCAGRYPGPAQSFAGTRPVETIRGYVPKRMTPDPAGYFVIYPDRERHMLFLEHYANTGVLGVVIEGATATEVYIPAVERGLVTRLDHAAYLGRELARAEASLTSGEPYVQDAAPELAMPESAPSCGCAGDGKT